MSAIRQKCISQLFSHARPHYLVLHNAKGVLVHHIQRLNALIALRTYKLRAYLLIQDYINNYADWIRKKKTRHSI